MRKLWFFCSGTVFASGCIASAISEYQSSAVISPDFDTNKAYTVAVLPPDYTGGKTPKNRLELVYEDQGDDDTRPDQVFIDGVSAGSMDWVDENFIKTNIPPGSHNIRVDKFMGDSIASARFYIGENEHLVLKLSQDHITELSRTQLQQADDPSKARDYLLDALTRQAMDCGLRPVERSKIDAVLKEQEFSYSGVVDPATAVKLGKLMGAELVLICQGSDSLDYEFENYIAVLSGRLVHVGTGQVVYAARARGIGFERNYALDQVAVNFFKALKKARENR